MALSVHLKQGFSTLHRTYMRLVRRTESGVVSPGNKQSRDPGASRYIGKQGLHHVRSRLAIEGLRVPKCSKTSKSYPWTLCLWPSVDAREHLEDRSCLGEVTDKVLTYENGVEAEVGPVVDVMYCHGARIEFPEWLVGA